ncbi:MAG: RIP metalloprotease RseP [Desulfobacterales bacterium]|nr:RIP metalloprotease RseP [Desulfobacterales bacterium]
MLTNIVSIIVVLGVLIFFHELGHFLVARYFGVGVEKFSLGFGPKIFGKTVGMTEYRLSAIPLGGYVKMLGDSPDAEVKEEEKHLSFTHKKVWQRMLIVAAGPFFNLVLAVLIYAGLAGVYGASGLAPVVKAVKPGFPAFEAGLAYGDRIAAVNGNEVVLWSDVVSAVEKSGGKPLSLTVDRNGDTRAVNLTPSKGSTRNVFGETVPSWTLGIYVTEPVIGVVQKDSPAEKAGVQVMDRFLTADGVPLYTWEDVVKAIAGSKGEPVTLEIDRSGEVVSLVIAAEQLDENSDNWRIGIGNHYNEEDFLTKRLGFFGSLSAGVSRTWLLGKLMVVGIVKMVQGKIPADVGGPIIISKMAGDQARVGISSLISFIAFISINLAILNFLPIPVLDGGHLLFFTIEWILGRPLGEKAQDIANRVGIFILMTLMIYVFYSDIMKTVFR